MMRLNSFWSWTNGPAAPIPTPTPTPTPATATGHIVWNKVAGEWRPIERDKDRLPEKLVEHLKSLANERSQASPVVDEPSRKTTPWSKVETSSKAEVLRYMGLTTSRKTDEAAIRAESAKSIALRRMIDEEDELLLYFDGKI